MCTVGSNLLNPKYMFIRHSFSVNILFYLCIQGSWSHVNTDSLWVVGLLLLLDPSSTSLPFSALQGTTYICIPFSSVSKICSTLEELLQDEVVEGGRSQGLPSPYCLLGHVPAVAPLLHLWSLVRCFLSPLSTRLTYYSSGFHHLIFNVNAPLFYPVSLSLAALSASAKV